MSNGETKKKKKKTMSGLLKCYIFKGKRTQFTKATVTTACLETGLTRNILNLHKTQSNIIKSKTFLKI